MSIEAVGSTRSRWVPHDRIVALQPQDEKSPPSVRYAGLTYGEWLAGFNKWILEVPAADNAILLGNEDRECRNILLRSCRIVASIHSVDTFTGEKSWTS